MTGVRKSSQGRSTADGAESAKMLPSSLPCTSVQGLGACPGFGLSHPPTAGERVPDRRCTGHICCPQFEKSLWVVPAPNDLAANPTCPTTHPPSFQSLDLVFRRQPSITPSILRFGNFDHPNKDRTTWPTPPLPSGRGSTSPTRTCSPCSPRGPRHVCLVVLVIFSN